MRQGWIVSCYLAFQVFILGVIANCNQVSTNELLNASFLSSGQGSIELLSPANQANVNENPVFAWSAKPGISLYKLEIATSADFKVVLLSREVRATSYALVNTDLFGISKLDPTSYYWRVSAAKITPNLQSNANIMQVLETAVYYVNASTSSARLIGNKTSPFKSIQVAIGLADANRGGDAKVPVAIRIAKGSYTEQLTLKPGISLYGGYDAGTNWSRNISANATNINAPLSIGVYCDSDVTTAYNSTTIVDGLTITGGTNPLTYGVYINGGAPTISNSTINGGVATTTLTIETYSNGIYSTGSAAPVVAGCTISGGTSIDYSYGIFSDSSSPRILSGNTISGGTAGTRSVAAYATNGGSPMISGSTINGGNTSGTSVGIDASGSAWSISGNTVSGGSGTNISFGIRIAGTGSTISNNVVAAGAGATSYCMHLSGGTTTVTNNTMQGGSGTNSYGILAQNNPQTITNNTVYGGSATNAYAIRSQAAPFVLQNNILFTGGGTTRYGYYEDDNGSSPTTFTNNVIFDAATALYSDCTSGSCAARVELKDRSCTAAGNFVLDFASGVTTCNPATGALTNPVGGALAGSGNRTTATVASTAGVFAAGYSVADTKTWIILGNGPADYDANGSWSTGDAGADISKLP